MSCAETVRLDPDRGGRAVETGQPAPQPPSTLSLRPGRRRIGLLGGSFNPAHEGHRHISLLALKRLRLDEVWWLVSPQNPLKPANGMAPFVERLAGARALASHPRIRATDLEARLGTRFTIDTLTALRRRWPAARFVWLMGADNMIQIPRWARWDALFETVPVAVLARPTYSLKAMNGKAAARFRHRRVPAERAPELAGMRPPAWIYLPIALHPASATEIRRRRTGRSAPCTRSEGEER